MPTTQHATSLDPRAPLDWLVTHTTLVTMDASRRVVTDAYLGVRGDRIVAIGKQADIDPQLAGGARQTIDGRRFVVTPGYVNAHIHTTCEPLVRGFVPDDLSFDDNVFGWLVPLYNAQTPEDECLAAQIAACEMLRSGTTCFLEAGTVLALDAVMAAHAQTGIRGRLGRWTMDRAFDPAQDQTVLIDAAVRGLEDEMARYPSSHGARMSAWPTLVGHSTNTDEVWKAAKRLANANGTGMSAHMSPSPGDAAWFLEHTGQRPMAHLAEIGVLGANVALTHAVHVDDDEVALLAASGTHVVHCPTAALHGGYGAGPVGRFPEMVASGVNVAIGTDGNTAGSTDMMKATAIVAGLFKDARRDTTLFPAHDALTMATLGGARALQLGDTVGSLEVGRKADFVLHATDGPEWRPLFNVVNHLVWSADGRSVHSVWVDGVRVVDDHRTTLVDEAALLARVEVAGRALVERSGLRSRQAWPVV